MKRIKKLWNKTVHEIKEFIRHEKEVKREKRAKEDMGNVMKQIAMGEKPRYRKEEY